jgi:shikimate dehydrogenase
MTGFVGLIGRGLKHSISPLFQQAAFDHLGLDIRYEVWETGQSELPAVVKGIRQPSKLGANVTIPYKEAVLALLDVVDRDAQRIGAVNTIVNREGKLTGYNTDSTGFLKALEQEGGFNPTGKSAVLLGAGGVARAASYALLGAGIKSLVVTDIITEKVHELVSDLERSLARGREPAPKIRALSPDAPQFGEALSGCDLLVNCTPMGMKHSAGECESPLEARLIPKRALVYDVVYNPIETPLLADAKKAGASTLGGLAMLVYQGAVSFELWTGKQAPVDIMMEVARKALL